MPNSAPCAFCQQISPLAMSHIIPSFVFRWLKDSSATGHLRSGTNPNQRTQDGLKVELLCSDCEALFNSWETPFASHLFHPYHSRSTSRFEYGDWMAKCLVSICWRAMMHLKREGLLAEMETDFGDDITSALSQWQKFLRGVSPDVDRFEIHVVPLDEIEASTESSIPDKMNRYLLRAVLMKPLRTQQSAFVVVKLARLLVVGFIREPEQALWNRTRVSISGGRLEPGEIAVPDWLLRWMQQCAEQISAYDSAVSERQRAKIKETLDKNPQRVLESETLRAEIADMNLRKKQGH